MSIGELLKEYRIKHEKKQSDFAGEIITQSYYSKVEKDASQISAQNLIDLLHYNQISVWEFFGKLDQASNIQHQKIEELGNMMTAAYYEVNPTKMKKIKSLINDSNLSVQDKREQNLMVNGFLELLNKNSDKVNKKLRNQIKDNIFNIPNFNQNKLMLYCDFMRFYNMTSNEIITKSIIRQYRNTKNVEIQELVLAIIVNILIFSIENNDYHNVDYFISNANKISTIPKLFFYKTDLFFFESLIEYNRYHDAVSLAHCQAIINNFYLLGMPEYGKELKRFLIQHN